MSKIRDEINALLNKPPAIVVHITRRDSWSDDTDAGAISLVEWIEYVNWDFQMELRNEYRLPLKKFGLAKEDTVYQKPGLSVWKAHQIKILYEPPSFEYERGNINVTEPDNETIKKMIVIAERMNAKVQGNDGKIYEYSEYFKESKNPWWKFW
ncbi:MAG: hypothetical protein V4725_08495 [Bacteroidota bacterium]